MAIPQGRMSTVPVIGEYIPPEGIPPHPLTTFEPGPIDVEDTTEGLRYQDWQLVWEPDTHDFVLTARTTLQSYIIANSVDVTYASFTFDKAGRVTFTWTNFVSSYLYWYDTFLGQTVTEDIGTDVITPTVYLDDKRDTQNGVNDMLLWYTKADGAGKYTLYNKIQRERFLIENTMMTDLESYYITALGMTYELRIQISLRGDAGTPVEPPPVNDPDNLDFESGDVNWTQEAGIEWSINQNMPQNGTWNASLNSSGAYSRFVNDNFFPVTGNQQVTISLASIGTVASGVAFGYQAYDAGFSYIGRFELGINVLGTWATTEWITNVPAGAVYIKLCTSSNGLVGVFHIDDFTIII